MIDNLSRLALIFQLNYWQDTILSVVPDSGDDRAEPGCVPSVNMLNLEYSSGATNFMYR